LFIGTKADFAKFGRCPGSPIPGVGAYHTLAFVIQ